MADVHRGDSLPQQTRPSTRRALILCLLCGFLDACSALLPDPQQVWPDGIPPVSYYVGVYEKDPENQALQSLKDYLYWIEGFYEGTVLYPRGWSDLVADQLSQSSGEESADRSRQLYRLGRDISTDWARHNRVRRIDNRHLAVWGAAAGRAIDEDNVDETLQRIAADVKLLLSGELQPDAVTAARYHEQEADDWFAF